MFIQKVVQNPTAERVANADIPGCEGTYIFEFSLWAPASKLTKLGENEEKMMR